jgi:hypothetical protein
MRLLPNALTQPTKRLLYALAPRWTTVLLSARARRHSHSVLATWGCPALNEKLIQHCGTRVVDGPFAGLVLTPMTHAEQLGPYLLGVYESELDDAWELALKASYAQIIDVGSKFGYYAVGLARRYPSASVIAFDTDPWARNATHEVASANDVHNLQIMGYCSPDWFAHHVQESALIISDCEGFETTLFGPATIPYLRSATLIIEVHECFVPGARETLTAAFAETHDVRLFGHGRRRISNRSLDFLSDRERSLATQEVRLPQEWLLCLPKTGPNSVSRAATGVRPG